MPASDLDFTPPVLFGLTAEELPSVLGGALLGWFLLAFLVGLVTGAWFLLLFLPVMGTVTTVYVVGRVFRALKRGRPTGWVLQYLYQLRARRLGMPVPWLHRTGVYELR